MIEKLKVNNRTNLALTTVLIMGSAGMTVVYVLCIFILCMRNEETQTNDDNIPSIIYDINPDACCNGGLSDYVKVK